jgi:HSP20 family protein
MSKAQNEKDKTKDAKDTPRRSRSMMPYASSGHRGGTALSRLRSEFDRLFEDFLGGLGGLPAIPGMRDSGWDLDVDDQNDKIVVRAEAPGFEPDDFDIQVRGNQLVLSASENEESQEDGGRHWRHKELFQSITLPADVDSEHVDAKYRNGILTVTLPKTEEGKSRRIEVKS